MSKKLEKCIDDALKNIEEDRKVTKELLNDAIKYVAVDEARHRDVNHSFADILNDKKNKKAFEEEDEKEKEKI